VGRPSILWSASEAREHEENEESITEDGEPAEDGLGLFALFAHFCEIASLLGADSGQAVRWALAQASLRPDSQSQQAGYCEAFATAGLTITE
jgi:hypothetical protein